MFTKAVLPDTLRAIQLASDTPEVTKAYLAGGTALALQIGHRISVDLDFFTQQEIDENSVVANLVKISEFKEKRTAWRTVLGTIGQTQFSIFYYKYPLLEPTVSFEGIHLASLADIAAMKINAIEDRGTRRDFIDVYFLSQTFSLYEMLELYQKKYGVLQDHFYAIIRSLEYFGDAQREKEMPKMLIPIDWEEIKEYFRKEVQRLSKEKLNL